MVPRLRFGVDRDPHEPDPDIAGCDPFAVGRVELRLSGHEAPYCGRDVVVVDHDGDRKAVAERRVDRQRVAPRRTASGARSLCNGAGVTDGWASTNADAVQGKDAVGFVPELGFRRRWTTCEHETDRCSRGHKPSIAPRRRSPTPRYEPSDPRRALVTRDRDVSEAPTRRSTGRPAGSGGQGASAPARGGTPTPDRSWSSSAAPPERARRQRQVLAPRR